MHSIPLDEAQRTKKTQMLECLICIPSSWMRSRDKDELRCWSAGLHCTLLDNVQGKKTNQDVGVLGFHSILLDEIQNIVANLNVNLPDAQSVSQ